MCCCCCSCCSCCAHADIRADLGATASSSELSDFCPNAEAWREPATEGWKDKSSAFRGFTNSYTYVTENGKNNRHVCSVHGDNETSVHACMHGFSREYTQLLPKMQKKERSYLYKCNWKVFRNNSVPLLGEFTQWFRFPHLLVVLIRCFPAQHKLSNQTSLQDQKDKTPAERFNLISFTANDKTD